MQKVAVFGNAGGGKSTLSRKLAEISSLPLYILDKLQYQSGGVEVPHAEYMKVYREILASDRWIIDGFGSLETVWERLDLADTLVYVDLPINVHFWWVTKRMLSGYIKPPPGWPENNPILQSSINSYRNLWLCHERLTPKYREYVKQAENSKNVYHIKSTSEISQFLTGIPNIIA